MAIFEEIIDSQIYLDNACTTLIDNRVSYAMLPYLEERFCSPKQNLNCQNKIEESRVSISELLGVDSDCLYFTSGAAEANNWAIKCAGRDGVPLCSTIDNSSVIESVNHLGGLKVSVDSNGVVDIDDLSDKLSSENVRIVTIQHCNSELGTTQDVSRISELVHSHGALFHLDASDSFGKWVWDNDDINADLISISSHKIHGPFGVGAIYVSSNIDFCPLIHGDGQEKGLRSGTLPVPNIIGFGLASELAWSSIHDSKRQFQMINYLEENLKIRHNLSRNGTSYAPHIASLNLPCNSDLVSKLLDDKFDICVAPSKHYVLSEIGLSQEEISNVLRVSVSRMNVESDINRLIFALDFALNQFSEK